VFGLSVRVLCAIAPAPAGGSAGGPAVRAHPELPALQVALAEQAAELVSQSALLTVLEEALRVADCRESARRRCTRRSSRT
jgi:hypothetical protein